MDERAATGSDYIKIISETFEEHGKNVPTLSYETIGAIIQAAHSHHLLAVAHTLQQTRARKVVEAGVDGLVHISPYDPPDPDFGQLLAAHHVFQSTNLISYAPVSYKAELAADPDLAPLMPSFMIDGLEHAKPFPDARHEYSMAALHLLKAARVPILAGTDIGYPYAPLLHAELEIMVRDGGLTPIEALMSATANTADAYHLPDRGRIKAGLLADLLLVEGDPTKTITNTRKIVAVWARGQRIDREAFKSKVPAMQAPPPPPMPARESPHTAYTFWWSTTTSEMSSPNRKLPRSREGGGEMAWLILTGAPKDLPPSRDNADHASRVLSEYTARHMTANSPCGE